MSEDRDVSRRGFLKIAGRAGALAGLVSGCAADGKSRPMRTRSTPAQTGPTSRRIPRPEPLANYHCQVGENPLWDAQRQLVYWTDIPAGRLFRYDVRTGEHGAIHAGEPVGGFTLQKDGALLLFQVNKFSLLRPDGSTQVLVENIDDDMTRFNDVIADPHGRVYAGTIGKNSRRGGLYLVTTDGKVTSLFKGTGCSNGMAFSPDGRHMYWTCTSSRKIFRFDYNPETGALTNRHELVAIGPDEGVPDGLTIDREGNLWSARWGGSAVYRYSPAGRQIGKIEFPVGKVSSATFGGADLDTLYVTTAGGSEDTDTPDGTLYRVKVAVRGLPEFRSDIRTP